MTRIPGRCHCGNIAFTLAWPRAPTAIPARACTCSFCVKHGGVWTSDPAAALIVTIEDPARVSEYEFGTRTARFHLCTRCGVVPVVTCEIDGRRYAVVSVNALEGVDPALLQRGSASFDAESVETRLARRQRNWIGDVTFGVSSGGH